MPGQEQPVPLSSARPILNNTTNFEAVERGDLGGSCASSARTGQSPRSLVDYRPNFVAWYSPWGSVILSRGGPWSGGLTSIIVHGPGLQSQTRSAYMDCIRSFSLSLEGHQLV